MCLTRFVGIARFPTMIESSNRYKMPEFVSVGDAARLLGVSVATVRNWEKAGKIAAIRTPGGQRRFAGADIDDLLRKGKK